MTVHPSARNLVRQMLPKIQPRRPKPALGFSEAVKKTIRRRSVGWCELDMCGPADHYHHRAPRGRGGTSLPWVNMPANALHLASACHDRIERNRAEAYGNGWLIRRNGQQTAAEVSVLYCGRWANLTDDGEVHPVGGEA